jgi:hypothetical protein
MGCGGAWHQRWVAAGTAISEQGQYFNDVSGKTGGSIEEVRAGLADVLLVTGSRGELKREFSWPTDVWNGLNLSAKAQVEKKEDT